MPNEAAQSNQSAELLTRLAFSIHGSPGVYAVLVGSGLSRAAGILTGWEVTLDLVRRVALAQGESDQSDWADWYRKKFQREPNYSDLIAELASSPADRRAILHGYIEPTNEEREEGHKVPTKAHFAIADLVHAGHVRVIITTNFDRLLENALRDRGVEPKVIDSVDVLEGAEPLTHTRCHLVKLHGDYKDARIRNTDTELAEYPPELDAHLDRILDEHGLIICGWSGEWDDALYSAIMRNPSRRYSLFWAARGPLGDRGQKIVAHRQGHIFQIVNADEFLEKLRDRVETIARTRRQDPRSVQLLVDSTKRYVSRPEQAIQLHDLLESEVLRLVQFMKTSTPQVPFDGDGIRSLVPFFESATEPLARMFGVLGQWGKGNERNVVVHAFLALWSQEAGTDSRRTHLQRYPAVLLVWSYGIGLTIAQRWSELHRLLARVVKSGYDDPVPVVEPLSKWFLEGYRTEIWKCLPDLKNRNTPASDHLCGIFDTWRDSFSAVLPDFEEVFDLWEILFAIAYIESHITEHPDSDDRWFWAPTGRNAWRFAERNRIIENIRTGALGRELISAGFGGGQQELLVSAANSYSDFANRVYSR